jgi:hypothetical protein
MNLLFLVDHIHFYLIKIIIKFKELKPHYTLLITKLTMQIGST